MLLGFLLLPAWNDSFFMHCRGSVFKRRGRRDAESAEKTKAIQWLQLVESTPKALLR